MHVLRLMVDLHVGTGAYTESDKALPPEKVWPARLINIRS